MSALAGEKTAAPLSRRARALRSARDEMIAVRERIARAAAGRSEEELLRPPSDGGWSAAEVLDHIATAERKLVKGLLKVEKGEPVRLPRAVWFYRLPMGLAFPRRKLRAPKPVRPRGRADIVPSQVLAGLETSRKELLALADRMGPERFSRFVFPHFLLGRFNGLAWFRFLARHEARHAAQLERVLVRRGPPATSPPAR